MFRAVLHTILIVQTQHKPNPSASYTVGSGAHEGGGSTGRGAGGVDVLVVGGEGRSLEVEYTGKGVYEGAVVAPVSCLLRVAVTVRGEHVAGSPFELMVHAGRTAPLQTYAAGDGWQRRVPLGVGPVSFVIHAHDAQGNPQSRPVDSFLVTLTPRARGNHAQQLRTSYIGGGETECKYELSQAGSYVLSVTLRGLHIKDSPFNIVAGEGFPSSPLLSHLSPPIPLSSHLAHLTLGR